MVAASANLQPNASYIMCACCYVLTDCGTLHLGLLTTAAWSPRRRPCSPGQMLRPGRGLLGGPGLPAGFETVLLCHVHYLLLAFIRFCAAGVAHRAIAGSEMASSLADAEPSYLVKQINWSGRRQAILLQARSLPGSDQLWAIWPEPRPDCGCSQPGHAVFGRPKAA